MIAASGIQSALEHISRGFRSSETRTPLIVSSVDGNPAASIDFLARQQNSRVWSINMEGASSEQNALDYVDVGVHNGDWVLLQNADKCSFDTLRKIGTLLMTLRPEPKTCPRREFFRLWLQVEQPINVNEHVKVTFPQIIVQSAIMCRAVAASASAPGSAAPSPVKQQPATAAAAAGSSPRSVAAPEQQQQHSPTKLVRRLPAEAPLLQTAMHKHEQRRHAGRDSDSESDADEPEKKATGMWFHRNVEFYSKEASAAVADYKKIIFDVVDADDAEQVKAITASGHVDIDKVKRDGMTPLQFAVSRQRENAVQALIAAGADVTLRRESDLSPLTFMAIENPVILQHLVAGGVDMKQKYEGYILEDHPLTSPPIAKLVREMRRSGAFN